MSNWGTADTWSRSGPRGHWRVMRGGTGAGYVAFMAVCDVCPAHTTEFCPNMTAAKSESTRWDERHAHAFADRPPAADISGDCIDQDCKECTP